MVNKIVTNAMNKKMIMGRKTKCTMGVMRDVVVSA